MRMRARVPTLVFLLAVGVASGADAPEPGIPDEAAERLRYMIGTWDTRWEILGPEARERYETYSEVTRPFTPEVPHYYLSMLGVRRDRAGRGLARPLLEAVHALVGRCVQGDDVTQLRQRGGVQRPCPGRVQLRQQLVEHGPVVAALEVAGGHQRPAAHVRQRAVELRQAVGLACRRALGHRQTAGGREDHAWEVHRVGFDDGTVAGGHVHQPLVAQVAPGGIQGVVVRDGDRHGVRLRVRRLGVVPAPLASIAPGRDERMKR